MKLLFAFTACLLLLGTASCHKHEATNDGGEGSLLQIGDRIPSDNKITNPALEYNAIGKVALVVFFSPGCPFCVRSMGDIQKIWSDFGTRDDFYLMCLEINGVAFEPYMMENGYTFPAQDDSFQTIFHTYATQSIPRFFLFNKAGFLAWQGTGFREDREETLRLEINKLL